MSRGRRVAPGTLTAIGAAIEVAVVLAVIVSPRSSFPVAPLAIAPLLPAIAGVFVPTAVLAVTSAVATAAILAGQGTLGHGDELVRLSSVIVIGALAIAGTRLQRRVGELAQALDALPDAVTIQGPGGVVLYGNRAASRLAGPGADQLAHDAAEQYLARMEVTFESGAPLDPEEMPAQRLLAGRSADPVVVRSLDPATGAVAWTRVQASPLRSPEGRVRSAVNVIEDISDVKRAEARAAFLSDAGAALAESLDLAVTLRRVEELVVPAMADWCRVDLARRRGEHPRPAQVEVVLRTGRPLLAADLEGDRLEAIAPPGDQAELEALGPTTALVVPLSLGPQVIGVMTWVAARARRPYGGDDLETATGLAARAAVAVENARVHGVRTEIAAVLQDALLPAALPVAPGWQLAAHYRAAGEANEVGGDFYDVAVLDDGAVVALVGDVAGKGARAAALTARTRHTLMTAAALQGGDPLAGLRLVSEALQGEGSLELCSVVAVVARGAELTVVSAGHPLPLLLRDGGLGELGRTSPMLGAAPPGQDWTTTTSTLEPGDVIVLHTDGVTDAVGRTDRFGDARLRAALVDGPSGDPQAVIDRVVAAVDAFEEGPQADDRALLALRYTG